ncbi:uncharacterized protein [Anser cygnoides]|uniref:uncharacterized protein n=1 Tax=Anser cygnoides TaxID=8845 RepID=UPI0034D186E5
MLQSSILSRRQIPARSSQHRCQAAQAQRRPHCSSGRPRGWGLREGFVSSSHTCRPPQPLCWKEGRFVAPLPSAVSKQKQNPVAFSPSEDADNSGTGGAFSRAISVPSQRGAKTPPDRGQRSDIPKLQICPSPTLASSFQNSELHHPRLQARGARGAKAAQPARGLGTLQGRLTRHRGSFELLTSRRVPHKLFGLVPTSQHPRQPDPRAGDPCSTPSRLPGPHLAERPSSSSSSAAGSASRKRPRAVPCPSVTGREEKASSAESTGEYKSLSTELPLSTATCTARSAPTAPPDKPAARTKPPLTKRQFLSGNYGSTQTNIFQLLHARHQFSPRSCVQPSARNTC